MNIKGIGFGSLDWIHLARVRDEWRACEYGNEPSGSIQVGDVMTSRVTVSLSRRTQLHFG
jgi:hypothetical protein